MRGGEGKARAQRLALKLLCGSERWQVSKAQRLQHEKVSSAEADTPPVAGAAQSRFLWSYMALADLSALPSVRPPTPQRAPTGILPRAVLAIVVATAASLFLLFILAPVVGLVAAGGARGVSHLAADRELLDSLGLTILTATAATLLGIVGGTPIAYLLARHLFRGRAVLAALMDLPLVIPHPVAGIALLLVLGRGSPVGSVLYAAGLRIAGSPVGIVCAMLFVSAPLYVSAARETFARVDPRYESVARTLGDDAWRAFRRVTLPLSARGLTAAAVVMWARAISEFGAIVILTYNPKVVSVLSYDRFTSYGLSETLPAAAVLVLFALIPLVALRALRAGDDPIATR